MPGSRTEKKLGLWAWGLHVAGLGISLIGCGLMLTRIILPLAEQNAEIVDEEAELKKTLDLEEALNRENVRLTTTLSQADQRIQSLLDRIPNVPRESDFLGQITKLAREVGVEIKDYHPGRVLPGADYHEMTLNLTSRGSYEGVCNFLHRLNSLPRLCRANKMSIQPVPNEQVYSMDMTVTIFFSPGSQLAKNSKGLNNG